MTSSGQRWDSVDCDDGEVQHWTIYVCRKPQDSQGACVMGKPLIHRPHTDRICGSLSTKHDRKYEIYGIVAFDIFGEYSIQELF